MKKEIQLRSILDDEGHLASPQLPEDIKNYLIDIDGTITDDVPNEEPERMSVVIPYSDSVETLNKWYDEGHIIFFFNNILSNSAKVIIFQSK